VTTAGLAPVIPLDPYRSRLDPTTAPCTPEPAQLYNLTVLAFLLHTPVGQPEMCSSCELKWPCEHLRLAYRLREGF
jgi:hypothetical protein